LPSNSDFEIYKKLTQLEHEIVTLRDSYLITNKRYSDTLMSMKVLKSASLEAAVRSAAAAENAQLACKNATAAAEAAAAVPVIAVAEAAADAAALAALAAAEAAAAASAAASAAAAAASIHAEETAVQASAAAAAATGTGYYGRSRGIPIGRHCRCLRQGTEKIVHLHDRNVRRHTRFSIPAGTLRLKSPA